MAAVRLALTGYIIPFIMLYKPGVVLMGSAVDIAWALFDTLIAVGLLAPSLEGYWRGRLLWWQRVLLLAASLALFVPGWPSRVVGLAVALPVLLLHLRSTGGPGQGAANPSGIAGQG